MGQAKIKRREGFAPDLIEEWEADDCINFAVALARLTGWLLHVDWWSRSPNYPENISDDQLEPLRVYVADNRDGIFDVRGVKTIADFYQGTIVKLAKRVATGTGGVLTRFYSEAELMTLPLRTRTDEVKVACAMEAIKANPAFLRLIPVRPSSSIPAYEAAQYTFGECAAFAEALQELTRLEPVALLARRFAPMYAGTKHSEDGFFHSVVLHPDGTAEDVWGRATLEDIAGRFGAIEFEISGEIHRKVVQNLHQSSGDLYKAAFENALKLIREYRLGHATT